MNVPLKTEEITPPLHHTEGAGPHEPSVDPDEEERAFLRKMMRMSQEATGKEIERLYRPIEMSE